MTATIPANQQKTKLDFFYTEISALKEGEIFIIENKSWPEEKSPVVFVETTANKLGYALICLQFSDNSGWMVKRLR